MSWWQTALAVLGFAAIWVVGVVLMSLCRSPWNDMAARPRRRRGRRPEDDKRRGFPVIRR